MVSEVGCGDFGESWRWEMWRDFFWPGREKFSGNFLENFYVKICSAGKFCEKNSPKVHGVVEKFLKMRGDGGYDYLIINGLGVVRIQSYVFKTLGKMFKVICD
ncbi:MAG: hypothetical protein ABSB80_11385 [Methanoregula sp.]|uniref:hypothetical protein n=1 Tax=Methanoregula sp. TaxID=2052170 RepID=UPI003D1265EF